jgi:glycosyltransferase involved in cell wall biosynthesis
MNRKLRIGILTPALFWGGAERCLINLARELRDRVEWTGCAMVYEAFRTENMVDEMKRYMPVYPGEAGGEYGMKAAWKILDGADAVICWGEINPAVTLDGFRGPRVFVTHGCGLWDCKALAAATGHVTHYVAVSDACLPILEGRNPTVIENGVEPERCLITRPRTEVRAEIGLTDNDFAVGYLGRMANEKNPAGIARVLALLPEEYKGVWVGEGYNVGALRQEIRGLLGSRAKFVDTVWDIGNYLQCFDLFALLSQAEGFSMSFLEACLLGVPGLTTNVGVMPTLTKRHGQLWATVDAHDDVRAVAKQIEAIRNDWRTGMRACEAQRVVRENYLSAHMAGRWLRYLERICTV